MSMTDGELAAHLAEAAGALLLEARRSHMLSASALGREGDRIANSMLVPAIRQHRPHDGLLSEEERDNPSRLGHSRVWIIDPVDGSQEYGEGRDDWAVHIGLAIDGVPAVGAVALPALGLVLRSDIPSPIHLGPAVPRMVVSRTRPPPEAVAVAEMLGADVVAMGSAGAKAMAVVRGEADIYLHTGGQFEWDSCAPAAVALAHGLHVSRADGSALRYNNPNPYLPDLLICLPNLAQPISQALAEHRDRGVIEHSM